MPLKSAFHFSQPVIISVLKRGIVAQIRTKKILDILKNDEQQIIIPIYQRNYDWKPINCTKLIKDIWEFRDILEVDPDSAYFIGSMIY